MGVTLGVEIYKYWSSEVTLEAPDNGGI
jgi:hypothetical protein